jgi:hypothetical protein
MQEVLKWEENSTHVRVYLKIHNLEILDNDRVKLRLKKRSLIAEFSWLDKQKTFLHVGPLFKEI